MTSHANDIRKRVSDAYAGAVSRERSSTASSSSPSSSSCCSTNTEREQSKSAAGSCCGSGSSTGTATATATAVGKDGKGVPFEYAGYDETALDDLPKDAVDHAFGCGNPLAFSEVHPGQTVLDLGSGAGIDLILAARKVGDAGRVIGVDMTDAMLDHARRNVEQAGLSHIIELRKGIIEELPVDDSSVDWVISNCVINLSPEKDRVFCEIARVLKPGGRMLVSDMVADELPDAILNDPGLYNSCIGGAVSEDAYLAGLRAAGLVDVEVRSRHTYDENALQAIADTEACGCVKDTKLSAAEIVHLLAGRIHSIAVSARKGDA